MFAAVPPLTPTTAKAASLGNVAPHCGQEMSIPVGRPDSPGTSAAAGLVLPNRATATHRIASTEMLRIRGLINSP